MPTPHTDPETGEYVVGHTYRDPEAPDVVRRDNEWFDDKAEALEFRRVGRTGRVPTATRTFDPGLIEQVYDLPGSDSVDIYKVGGGTVGKSYTGFWGYRLRQGDAVVAAGGDLHTGTPATHTEAASLVLAIFQTTQPS